MCIRDRLEYGVFKPNKSLNEVQYIERLVLQCRQHIPIISDKQLIEKLSHHFDKEIQVAVVNREINNIKKFKTLLREYTGRKTRVINVSQAVKERTSKKVRKKRKKNPKRKKLMVMGLGKVGKKGGETYYQHTLIMRERDRS